MANPNLNEEQKFQLNKLRRRLEMTPQAFLPEEKRRFYQSLDTLEGKTEEAGTAEQDGVALQVLLKDLKMLAVRLGKNHGLYTDVIDTLKSLAPEMVAEAERMAENEEQEREREIRQRTENAQQRFEDRFPWLKPDTDPEKEEEKKEEKGFFEASLDRLLSAIDKAELTDYIRRKIEGSLTHDDVVNSRKSFRERARSRIEEELKKEKPDEKMCRKLTACEGILNMGWNVDDIEMVNTFTSLLELIPISDGREEGDVMLSRLISQKVGSWEERQIMFDDIARFVESAEKRVYPDGKVDPLFREAAEKILKCTRKTVSKEEYPDDPQFGEENKEKEKERITDATRAAVNYVMGTQDFEQLRLKRTMSISESSRRKSQPELEVPKPADDTHSGDAFVCSLEATEKKEEKQALAPRNTGRLILDFAVSDKEKEGYLDAASGEFYEMDRLSELPKGVYFGDGEYVFRLTSISELDDLMNTIHHGVSSERRQAEDRIRRNAKQWFVDNKLDFSYRDEKEREQILAKTSRAEEKLLHSQSEKYGMKDLQQAIFRYREANQRGDSADEIEKRENELIRNLREYMERIPEKIGRTTCQNLEFACDLLCGIQRESNFRKKMRQFDIGPKKEEKQYPWEVDDILKTQEMVGENSNSLMAAMAELDKIGKIREYNTEAFTRMHRALNECIGLSAQNSIREMTGAYQELRMATLAFGKERGWNGMEAIGEAKDEKERSMIAQIQLLSRTGRVMADRLMDRSSKITNKSMPVGQLLLQKLEEEDLRMEKEKEMEKEKSRSMERPVKTEDKYEKIRSI